MSRSIAVAFGVLWISLSALADAPRARVAVAPFRAIERDVDASDWSHGLQRSLMADLAREKWVEPIELPSVEGIDEDFVVLARMRGADFVVTGEFQNAGHAVRITGRVIAVKDGVVVGGMKITGDVEEWFDLQDAAGKQAIRGVQARLNTPPARPAVASTLPKSAGPSRNELAIAYTGPVSVAPAKARFAAWGSPRTPGGEAAREALRRYNYGYPLYPYPYFFAPAWIGWNYGGWWW